MSKSLGNVIQPQAVIKESGAEILRLWVAMSDFREELRVGKQILAARRSRRTASSATRCATSRRTCTTSIRRRDRVPLERMQEVDRFIAVALRRHGGGGACAATSATTIPAIFQTLNQFLTVDLSAFYADVSKDRLYTFAAGVAGAPVGADGDVRDGRRPGAAARADPAGDRRRVVAPPPGGDARRNRCTSRSSRATSSALIDADLDARWTRLREIRDEVNRALETARQEKLIGTSLAAHVTLDGRRRHRGAAAPLRGGPADAVHRVAGRRSTRPAPTASASRCRAPKGEKCERCWRVVAASLAAPGHRRTVQPVHRRAAAVPSTGSGQADGRSRDPDDAARPSPSQSRSRRPCQLPAADRRRAAAARQPARGDRDRHDRRRRSDHEVHGRARRSRSTPSTSSSRTCSTSRTCRTRARRSAC